MNESDIDKFVEDMLVFLKSDKCKFPEFASVFIEGVSEIKNMFESSNNVIITAAINDSVNIVETLYMEHVLNQENIDILLKYLLLLHNANSNFINNDELSKRIAFLDRCLTNLMTSVDAISVMRSMIFRTKQYANYGMPSIELSKLYVESME